MLPAAAVSRSRPLVAVLKDHALDVGVALACAVALFQRPEPLTLVLAALLGLLSLRAVQLRRRALRAAQLQQAADAQKQMLVESIECAPLAFALYDPADRLIAWNRAYESYYPKAFEAFRATRDPSPLRYADLLLESAPRDLSGQPLQDHIALRIQEQRRASGVPTDRNYATIGWRRVTKFATPSGAVAGFAVDITESKRYESQLQDEIQRRRQVEAQLKERATTDPLTATLNRRAFMETVEAEIARFRRYRTPASLVVLDVDWFKAINDTFGHQVGDEALVAIAKVVQGQIRGEVDRFGRIGGEEFCLLLPGTSVPNAAILAERIRAAIQAIRIRTAEGQSLSLTASFGVSSLGDDNARLTTLIGEADRAMYVSKIEGRNRVTCYVKGLAPQSTAGAACLDEGRHPTGAAPVHAVQDPAVQGDAEAGRRDEGLG